MEKPLGPGGGAITIPTDSDEELEIVLPPDEDGEELAFAFDENGAIVPHDETEERRQFYKDNLAEEMDPGDLRTLASELIRLFDEDDENREEWRESYKRGMQLLGLKIERRSDPWENACGVFHPLIAEMVVRYVSEAILETFPAQGPALTEIIGKETPDLLKRATRVKDELNYILTKKMPEYRQSTEMILFRQGLAGSVFRKIWYDDSLKRIRSCLVDANDLVVAHGAVDLDTCHRYTHVMRPTLNEVRKLIHSGFYRDYNFRANLYSDQSEIDDAIDEATGQEPNTLLDDRVKLLEMYVELDLPGFEHRDENGEKTGIGLFYIVTIDYDSSEVISIYRHHEEDDHLVRRRKCFFHYKYFPGLGFYGIGGCHLLGGIAESATSITRQLVDSGTLSNLQSGFKAKGLRARGDDTPLRPGEWRDVDVPSGKIQDSLMPIPTKEPSQVLANLLGVMVDEGRRIGSVADAKIGDMNGQAPVGTTLAIIERVMRPMSAVQARTNATLGEELEYISFLVQNELPDEYEYPVDGTFSRRADFGPPMNIIPVADPAAATISQRMIRYQAALELSQTSPELYDRALLHRQMLETLEIKNADRIVPLKDDMIPVDPVCENMNILMMRPVKAFMEQDHEAHIQVHMAALHDPLIMQMVGQSPNAPAIQGAAMAHIQEHVAYAYRARMCDAMGLALPSPDQAIPPEMEVQLSRMAQVGAAQVLAQSQQQAQAQQAQAQAQDPKLQLEQQKLQIKDKEITTRQQMNTERIQADLQIAEKEAEMEDKKLQAQEIQDQRRVQAETAHLGAKLAADQEKSGEQIAAQDRRHAIDTLSKASALATEERMTRHKEANKDADSRRKAAATEKAARAKAKAPAKPKKASE